MRKASYPWRIELDNLTAGAAKRMRKQFGVGPQTAAILLAVAGDNPERLRSEASLASLCGVNPLEASSGKTAHYRLNRGGNRAANNALWTIAMVRMRSDPRTNYMLLVLQLKVNHRKKYTFA